MRAPAPARIGGTMNLVAHLKPGAGRLRAAAAAAAASGALAALLALGSLAAPDGAAAEPSAAARAAPQSVAQQSGATLYGVELIVFRASSVNASEDWDAVPPGRGFGGNATRGGAS